MGSASEAFWVVLVESCMVFMAFGVGQRGLQGREEPVAWFSSPLGSASEADRARRSFWVVLVDRCMVFMAFGVSQEGLQQFVISSAPGDDVNFY